MPHNRQKPKQLFWLRPRSRCASVVTKARYHHGDTETQSYTEKLPYAVTLLEVGGLLHRAFACHSFDPDHTEKDSAENHQLDETDSE